MGIVLVYFNSDFILTFLNVNYKQNGTILTNFKISLLISFLFSLNLPLEQAMFAYNKNKEYIIVVLIVTVTNVLLSYFLITRLEILGIIFAIIITELMQTIAYKYILRNEINSIL